MKPGQFAERIGNIDDMLLMQAVEAAGRQRPVRRNTMKRIAALVAVLCIMICSGAIGALAFSDETFVEVPVQQEIIEIDDIGLSLILPDSWKGRYALEKNEWGEYVVYNPQFREAFCPETGGGMLFYIVKIDEILSPEQIENSEYNYAANRYLFATKYGTYLLYYASDVQCAPEDYEEYAEMSSQIMDIKIVVNNILE